MIARTITVNQQTRNKQTTTPKGRTHRTIPMTSRPHDALKRMSYIRERLVVRNLDGSAKTDDQADKAIQRICRRAGLPARLFHTLRHTFGTRRRAVQRELVAAAVVARPQADRRDDDLRSRGGGSSPRAAGIVREAARGIDAPDARVLAMLGARGSHVAAATTSSEGSAARPLLS